MNKIINGKRYEPYNKPTDHYTALKNAAEIRNVGYCARAIEVDTNKWQVFICEHPPKKQQKNPRRIRR